MKALLISYDLKNSTIAQRTNLHQTLYSYTDYSNGGRYKYERRGLLNKYRSIKLNRGVFIIDYKDKKHIIPILNKNNANIKSITIDIPELIFKKMS